MTASPAIVLVGNQWVGIHTIWGMSAMGRFLPATILSPDRLLLGESGHRNFDAKPRVYDFVSDCLGSGSGRSDRIAVIGERPCRRYTAG